MARRLAKKAAPAPAPIPAPAPAPIPPPRALVGEVTRGAGARWTADDDEEQLLAILQLRLRGVATGAIVRAMRERHGVGLERTSTLLRRGLERLADQLEADHPFRRAEAVARLRQDLADLHNPGKDAEGRPRAKDWRSIVAVERLLADVEGTREPVEVKVDVRLQQATVAVITALSAEERQELLDRARERRDLAEAAVTMRLVPAPARA